MARLWQGTGRRIAQASAAARKGFSGKFPASIRSQLPTATCGMKLAVGNVSAPRVLGVRTYALLDGHDTCFETLP